MYKYLKLTLKLSLSNNKEYQNINHENIFGLYLVEYI